MAGHLYFIQMVFLEVYDELYHPAVASNSLIIDSTAGLA
jgi:hypothetical protein